jgi:hypothetical protein
MIIFKFRQELEGVYRLLESQSKRVSYVVVVQNDVLMADCFSLGKFTIYDGHISLWNINSKGDVIHLVNGTVINGKFNEVEDEL